MPSIAIDGQPQKIPHIGWSALLAPPGLSSWEGTLLADVRPSDAFYFVHSFMAVPKEDAHRIADCLYGGIPISAAIGGGNIFGCQFHPEKSGEFGLKVLRRFLAL